MSKKVSLLTRWWTRVTHFEFWPFWLIYTPIMVQYLYYGIKARSFFFFSASNPGIEFSGMLGESKIRIYEGIEDQYLPKTAFLHRDTNPYQVLECAKKLGLQFPFVLKPDRGERGWMVKVIRSETQLKAYLEKNQVDFLIQEWIDLPMELAIFYHRHPRDPRGTVSSIAVKEFYQIVGDGKNSISALIDLDVRGKMFKEKLFNQSEADPNAIPEAGQTLKIGQIGNHSLGTVFRDGNSLINEQITAVIDEMSKNIDGFYFGRFDIRCADFSSAEKGTFKIIELNGSGSEPAHIFDPKYSAVKAIKDISHHLKKMYQISTYNHAEGVAYMKLNGFLEMMRMVKSYRKLQKTIQ